jgi:hypothetical protein
MANSKSDVTCANKFYAILLRRGLCGVIGAWEVTFLRLRKLTSFHRKQNTFYQGSRSQLSVSYVQAHTVYADW